MCMCEAFVAQQGRVVVPIPANGWCLVAAVAQVMSMEQLPLLQQALGAMRDLGALTRLSADESAQLRAAAASVAG